jgi:hypothetical protein
VTEFVSELLPYFVIEASVSLSQKYNLPHFGQNSGVSEVGAENQQLARTL